MAKIKVTLPIGDVVSMGGYIHCALRLPRG